MQRGGVFLYVVVSVFLEVSGEGFKRERERLNGTAFNWVFEEVSHGRVDR